MSGRGDNNKSGSSGRGTSNQSTQGAAASDNGKSGRRKQTGGKPSEPQQKQADQSSNRNEATEKEGGS